MKLLAVSGSLGARSSNGRLLDLVATLAPETVDVVLAPSVGDLPHFRPDADEPGPEVTAFRQAAAGADGVVIATPEYSHNVPGSLKNALDWLVGSGELNAKPVVVLNAAPTVDRGGDARAALLRTLEAHGATVVHSAAVPLTADEAVEPSDEAIAAVRHALGALPGHG